MTLSVLMSVYQKESPSFLCECLDSLVAQTLTADEVVIVEDGPLGVELQNVIAAYSVRLGIVSVRLAVNVGLGESLRAGLQWCQGEFVARMDSDDICVPQRFELQIDFLKRNPRVDVVSGVWAEFDQDPSKPHSLRCLPATGEALLHYAKYRNPINHVTAVFRRAAVLAAGSYEPFPGFEDYHLWARMLMLGYSLYNLQKFQLFLHEIGLLNAIECTRNIVVRGPIRLAPNCIRGFCYKLLLRRKFIPDLMSRGNVKPLEIGATAGR
jgi:glycosyltransferase involved in cell wall biosynthesis